MKDCNQIPTIKVGDVIGWESEQHIVAVVENCAARIVSWDGSAQIIEACINEYFIQPNHDFGSILDFLTIHAGVAKELTKTISEEEMKTMSTVKTKKAARGGLAAENKALKFKAPRTPKEPKAPKAPKVPKEKKDGKGRWVGISSFIGEQVEAGKDNDEVLEATQVKYPGCGKAWVKTCADKKRAKKKQD